jgi:hypothetical protein
MNIVLSKTGVKCAYLRFLMYKVGFWSKKSSVKFVFSKVILYEKKLVLNVRINAFWYTYK